jgi:prepilin signal peptidase PulO-like enzyme (type II secretory pathway)
MGFGDVKLSFILGFLLGYPLIIVSLYLAFLTGAAVAIILVVCRKTKFFGGSIPFGPFLVASTVISLFYGQEILRVFLMRFFP